MSPLRDDLPYFDKKLRGKIRLSMFMGELLHIIYLAAKNYRKSPELICRYNTFEQFVNDVDFIRSVLAKESRSGAPRGDPRRYAKIADDIKNRGYEGLLDLLNIVWDLTTKPRIDECEKVFKSIIGQKLLTDAVTFSGKVGRRCRPFTIDIKGYKLLIVEARLGGAPGALAKTLTYIGSLEGADRSLGIFLRFSARDLDIERLLSSQSSGHAHVLFRAFKLYPTVLRMQRLAYRKVRPTAGLDDEVVRMISELYIKDNHLASIINGDAPANILSMAPSVTLGGGLCIPTAFRGQLLGSLTAGEARIKAADTTLKAYPSYYTVLPCSTSPGDYVFVALHPFTIPRVALVVATYQVDILDKIKPRMRNVSSLDGRFPKIRDVVKTRGSVP